MLFEGRGSLGNGAVLDIDNREGARHSPILIRQFNAESLRNQTDGKDVSLIKERDDLKKPCEGIDPEQARAALTEKQRAEEDKLLSGGPTPHPIPLPSAEREKIEKVVENRIKGVKADLEIWRSGWTRKCPKLLICSNRTQAAAPPAKAPVESVVVENPR